MDLQPLQQLCDAQLREEVGRRYRRLQQAEADYLQGLRELDDRPDAVAGARPGRVAETFARHRLRRSRAAADVRAAHALTDDLPTLGEALATATVSREHVDVAVRTLRQIPAHLLDDPATMAKVDTWFTETSQDLPPMETDKVAKHLLYRLDPDGRDTFDPKSVDRRELSIAVDPTGMVVIRGQLDPANGAAFKSAIEAMSAPAPAEKDGGALSVPDQRSKRQRQADAAGAIGRMVLAGMGTGRAEIDRPRLVIHLPANESEQTGPLTPAWIARFACDSVVETVDTKNLLLGHASRTASPAQRRYLIARDGGCVIPGCHTPGAWCDAHHVQWWSQGGETNVDNMAMVCSRHHTDIHAGTWSLTMIDGVPWVKPPRWLDPDQRLTRNTYRDHHNTAAQLAIDLRPPPDDG